MVESGPKTNYIAEIGMIWAPKRKEKDYQVDGREWHLRFAGVFT